jgi:hypothetical protein
LELPSEVPSPSREVSALAAATPDDRRDRDFDQVRERHPHRLLGGDQDDRGHDRRPGHHRYREGQDLEIHTSLSAAT